MIIEQSFTVRASREETSAFFLDIERVAKCIPGVDNVEEVEPGRYQAVLGVRLGPIRAAFQGAMSLDDSQAPERLRAAGEGRDRATGSVAKVDFTAELYERTPGETTVKAVADVALRGRMAQFGTGVMRAAAGELVQEFASCANAALAPAAAAAAPAPGRAPEAPAAAAPPAPAAAAPPRGMLVILVRSLVKAAASGLRALASRLRAKLGKSDGGRR